MPFGDGWMIDGEIPILGSTQQHFGGEGLSGRCVGQQYPKPSYFGTSGVQFLLRVSDGHARVVGRQPSGFIVVGIKQYGMIVFFDEVFLSNFTKLIQECLHQIHDTLPPR